MPNKAYFNISQGSAEWQAIRSGVITGTGIANLITASGKLSESEAAKRYIRELQFERRFKECLELLFPSPVTYAMQRGKEMESEALRGFDVFSEFCSCGFVLHDSGIFGVSPDSVKIDEFGKILTGLEIKCPQSRSAFIDLWECRNGNDLRKANFAYWLQVQLSMYVCECSTWNFFAYVTGYSNTFVVEKDSTIFELFDKIKI